MRWVQNGNFLYVKLFCTFFFRFLIVGECKKSKYEMAYSAKKICMPYGAKKSSQSVQTSFLKHVNYQY